MGLYLTLIPMCKECISSYNVSLKSVSYFTDNCDNVEYYSGGYRCTADGKMAGTPNSALSQAITLDTICMFIVFVAK